MQTGTEGHVVARVGSGDVESGGMSEHAWVAVGATQRQDVHFPSGDALPGDLDVTMCGAQSSLHRTVKAQDLLDRARPQVRVLAQLRQLVGMLKQQNDAVADQVHRGLEAGVDQQRGVRRKLTVRQGTAHGQATKWGVARVAVAQLFKVLSEVAVDVTQGVDGAAKCRPGNSDVEQRDRPMAPLEQLRAYIHWQSKDLGDDGHRQLRRVGVGRASLYRRFPTKALLVDAVLLGEVRRYFDGNARARASGATCEERMVNGTVFAVKFLREHTLLNRLMRTEPETILPSLTVDADAILDLATEQGATEMATELYGTATPTPAQKRHLRTVAELHTRLVLSFILTPHTGINLDTVDEVRAFAHDYLLPMITAADNP